MKYLTLACLLLPFCAFSQTEKIDSILGAIRHAPGEREQLRNILLLCEEYKSLNRDTLDKYAYLAQDLAGKDDDLKSKAGAELAMSYMYWRWGWIDSSMVAIDKGLKMVSAADDDTRGLYFKLMRQKALGLGGADRLQESLVVLYRLIEDAETYRDTLTLSSNLNTLGSVSLARDKPAEAITWLSKAIASASDRPAYSNVRSAIYLNLANAYNQLGKPDSAEYYINKGIALCYQTGNLDNLAIGLQRKAAILLQAKKPHLAEAALMEMLETRKKLGDPEMWVNDNISLARFYIETGQTDKAIDFCKRLLREGNRITTGNDGGQILSNNIRIRLAYYEILAECYRLKGDQTLHSEMLEKIVAAKDSFYEANSAEAIAELQTRYEVQKKENTIIQQQYALLKKDYFLYGSLILLGLSSLAAWLIFSGYRKRQKLETELILQKEKERAELAVAKAEESERRRIAADLHDNLGTYAASIVSNLEFIQSGAPAVENKVAMQELRHNSLAIVSQLSDTIWVLNKESLSFTAISDRIKSFFLRLEPSFPATTFTVNESIGNDIVLPSIQAFHLYQIVREATNNALRHSHCSAVKVTIESHDSWRISIEDNGTGMQPGGHRPESGGNGLANMRHRAEISGWAIDWASETGKGTIVAVSGTAN